MCFSSSSNNFAVVRQGSWFYFIILWWWPWPEVRTQSLSVYFFPIFTLTFESVKQVWTIVRASCIIFAVISLHAGTDINDKLRSSLNTPALMKMLNTSEAGDLATPRMEDTNVTSMETPLSDQDKMMLETPLRTSLTLECDMYESDVMLDTLSDTSTWSHPATRWNCRGKMFFEININKIMDTVPHHPSSSSLAVATACT